MSKTIHVALIYGSTREGRLCEHVGTWAAAEITARDAFTLDVIDPARFDLTAGRHGPATPAPTLASRIGRADATVVVTPEYNHGYPAPLKALIDALNAEWQAKPVAFVSYGGRSGGIRAVEQLRTVFAELHAVTIRETVSLANAWDQFDEAGRLRQAARAQRAMAAMLASLQWWAAALRFARRAAPYDRRAELLEPAPGANETRAA